jgi:uncharacterized protein YdhG (YjbR/CyaY superfamily)
MANRPAARSVDEYIAQFPPETQKVLADLRKLIRATAPGVTEKISYAIPTFNLNGRYLVYFAGWKKHIAFYPVTGGMANEFGKSLEPYQSGKATLQFPLDKPMPRNLIRRIVKFRMKELSGRAR